MNLTFRQGGKGVILYSYEYKLLNVNWVTSTVLSRHVLFQQSPGYL